MKFKQSYSVYESDFGSRELIVVISDNYNDLFTATEGYEVNNIQIKNVKQELNIEENTFAIDSFQFTIRETTAITENEKNCLSFVLHASDLKRLRFIGVFFDSVSTSNKLFAGQISSKIAGNDIYYTSDIWSIEGTKREYNFTALSFDISILERVLFHSKIEKEDGSFVDGLYERIDNTLSVFLGDCGFASKASFYYNNNTYYTYPIAPLYNVINAYLGKASDILTDLLGYGVVFNLEESNLDFKLNTMVYTFNDYNDIYFAASTDDFSELNTIAVNSTKIQAELKQDDGLWIHRGLIQSSLTEHTNAEKETELTFEQFENIAEFLSSIAKNLGCFIKITESAGVFNVKFINRGSVIASDATALIGFKDGSIDTSSVLIKEGNEYFAKSTYWTKDGIDELLNNEAGQNENKTSVLLAAQGERLLLADKRQIKTEPLLFSTSFVVSSILLDARIGKQWKFPLNVLNGNDVLIEAYSNSNYTTAKGKYYDDRYGLFSTKELKEVFYSTLYVKSEESPKGSWTNIYRPAYNVSVNVAGVEYEFETLTEYINYLIGREKQYYETERNLTIPYWNGFQKSGSNSWKNLTLGSKFNETTYVRDYDEFGVWTENEITKTYIITSIEWTLEKPEVKIKGQLSEKYSFSTPSNTTQLVQSISITSDTQTQITDNVKLGTAATTIKRHQALVMLSNGNLIPADKEYLQGVLVGIALNDAIEDEVVYYQINGNIIGNFEFSNYQNSLRVESGLTTDWNYTDDWTTFNVDDYRLMTIGEVINETTFKIKLNDYVLNKYIPV